MTRTSRAFALAALIGLSAVAAPASAFDERYHADATRNAFSFLRPTVIDTIVAGNLSQDHGFVDPKRPSRHFDDCEFSGATDFIRTKYGSVLNDVRADQRPQPLTSAYGFGRLVDPLQDFYAHSNWVEWARADLLDARLGPWRHLTGWSLIREDLVVGQGESVPDGWRVLRGTAFLPRVETPEGLTLRVVTTGDSKSPRDDCHDDMTVSHGLLNKDNPDRGGFARAHPLAVRQTEHEWCRLLHQSRARYGDRGPSMLLGLWVRPGGFPHPQGTPCQGHRGTVGWRVGVASIRVKDPRDGDSPGEINLASVLYHRDLRGSSRREIGPLSIRPNRSVPADDLPAAMKVCAESGPGPIVTVQGWDDDEGRDGELDIASVLKRPGHFPDTDDVIAGVTLAITAPGSFNASSSDLVVRFTVEPAVQPDTCQTTAPG